MALRKEKIVEAAGVQRSGGAGEKEEVLGIAFGYLEIPLCTPAASTIFSFLSAIRLYPIFPLQNNLNDGVI
ncbi:hypothetical protein [Nostoc flagelliforme]|uniref:hypothetical protein n=1 Tax=Nostoc flagelliforme TaxID=1306274 RepID=UPI000C2CEEE4|nr:hypothetical protein [Nostoc flagelliforme]